MNESNEPNRLLIIDDHPKIHDAFSRIFQPSFTGSPLCEMAVDISPERDLLPAKGDLSRTEIPFRLTHSNSGEAGLEALENSLRVNQPFAVAFVDIHMPGGIDGIKTAQELWKLDPNLHVVICSGEDDLIWYEVLEPLTHRDHLFVLKKPFDAIEVRQLAVSLCQKNKRFIDREVEIKKLQEELETRRASEENMRRMAHRDSLTNLPNRPYLLDKLNRIVGRFSQHSEHHQAILFLDLDHFKVINDSLGHEAGDDLLNQVAQRIGDCVRHQDMTTRVNRDGETVRLGGDEFVVLLEQLAHRHDALSIADRIVARINEPFKIGERKVSVGTSVGIAFLDHQTRDAHEALRNADTAMYRAKNSGKGQVAVFDKTMHQELVERLELESQIRVAVQQENLSLRYQPIVDLSNGRVLGVEVLTRWTTEDGRNIPPSQFIPIIEEIGLISRVGEWAIERAAIDLRDLTENLPISCDPNFYLGFNIARRQLSDPLFFEHLETIISRTGFDRHRLKVEISESGDHRNEVQILQNLLNLHAAGIGIQIDDFGKGKSSLTCFQDYPVETVKIDRSFTANIATNHSHSVITQAIVNLAHDLDARIVAEGVESETQLKLLHDWGCDAAQGFFISEPLESQALRSLLSHPEQSLGICQLATAKSVPIVFDASALIQTNPSLQNR